MKYLLGIDFGGGASKATLINKSGKVIAEAAAEYETLYPEKGACEQAPKDWITALISNISSIIETSGIKAHDIICIAIDSATHSSLVCDKSFSPLRNAMHWTDTRSAPQAAMLKEKYGDFIFRKTAHKPDTIWTLPQLLWLKENEPELSGKIRHIFFEKDYIRFFLTGKWCTDYIEAEGSMLFDMEKRCWSPELCELAGIDPEVLPPVISPTDSAGVITPESAKITGLCAGTPVICGTTDTVLEIFASGAINCGDITVKLATAGRICVITDRAYPDRHLVNYSHIIPGLWYPGTATKAAAASYRWYRDTFGGDYKTLDELAAGTKAGADGLLFHPYLNGELTPYADPALCASFTGIRATHTRAHFSRAVLEGVAFSLLDSKRYLDGLSIPYNSSATLIGGGAKGRLWQQIVADVLGITLKTTMSSDSSLGSAMLAGVASGVFADARQAVESCVKPGVTVEPNLQNTEIYSKIFEEYKKIHDALAPIYGGRML